MRSLVQLQPAPLRFHRLRAAPDLSWALTADMYILPRLLLHEGFFILAANIDPQSH